MSDAGWTVEMWTHEHRVAVVRRGRWRRTRFYIDGERVSRWHPFLRELRGKPYQRQVLGL